MISKLEAVARGEIRRLAIFMPPGSAKSTYASMLYPPWWLTRRPTGSLIISSYAAQLAEKWSRRVRNLIAQNSAALSLSLADDSQSVSAWALKQGGECRAVGVGGGITGHRADGGIIDDPVSGREDAESETMRNKAWDWYQDDFLTRLKPGAWEILIMTRWHEDDLAGRAIEQGKRIGDPFEVVSLPAIAEEHDALGRAIGEPLWPEWQNQRDLEIIRARGHRTWSALYQQRPQPEEGDYFRKSWFKRWSEMPESLLVYGTSDYAVTDSGGDYTVHRVWGVDHESRIYMLDGWRGQTTSDVWIERLLDLVKRWKPLGWYGEGGVIQKAIEPMLQRRCLERQVFANFVWLPSIHDKPTRARGFQSRAAMGLVHVPDNPIGDAWIDELIRFPSGKHDDEVDAASLFGRALDEAFPAGAPVKAKPKRRDHWDAGETEDVNWRIA